MSRFDLHTHSRASDGTDSPATVMQAAAAAGLTGVALTDHDTTAGWDEAAAARPDGLSLIRGAEFSTSVPTKQRPVSVHLLGYLFDPRHPALLAEFERQRQERLARGLAMVRLMEQDGVPITGEQVLDIADGAPVGRPHVGMALVQAGLVSSVSEAFGSYLSARSRYYVPKHDIDLVAAVDLVVAAGGVPVIAHPRGRGESRGLTVEVLGRLVDRGLAGLEVRHPDHDAAARAELTDLARRFDLIVTGSSDYHGTNKAIALGAELTEPAAVAALVARSSGVTPLLGPGP